MEIQITEGIQWDTEHPENIEARQWINENVLQKETPELDRFKRPVKWVKETPTARITIEREYINPKGGSWAKKGDTIKVESKNS